VVDQSPLPSDTAAALKQQIKTTLASGITAVVAAVAVMWAVDNVKHFNRGEAEAKVWFYDQNAKRLYPAPRDLIPPDGNSGFRVRAMVIGFRGMGNDVSQLKIAYLEKYSPEFKALLEEAAAAHTAKQPFTKQIPSANSDYFRENTFVKRPDESEWHSVGTDEGRQIMADWREWSGPAGQSTFISVPSVQ
jgi:hypothetical protein